MSKNNPYNRHRVSLLVPVVACGVGAASCFQHGNVLAGVIFIFKYKD